MANIQEFSNGGDDQLRLWDGLLGLPYIYNARSALKQRFLSGSNWE